MFEFDRVRPTSTEFDQSFVFSNFRERFSFFIRGKRNHQEDHENTKVQKHEKMRSVASVPQPQRTKPCLSRFCSLRFCSVKQRTASDRPTPQVDAGVIRLKFIPNCQRSIVVVRFWFLKIQASRAETARNWLRRKW